MKTALSLAWVIAISFIFTILEGCLVLGESIRVCLVPWVFEVNERCNDKPEQ